MITNAEGQSLLEARGLKKSFALKPILRGVDLTICAAERVALLGANGAGKTTLLRMLAGLTRPDAGSFSIAGSEEALHISRLVGFVAHQPYLYEELTVLENLLFFARMYAVKQPRERARVLLARVDLERRSNERVATLSRGQLQRLAWARALLHSPRLLLLDEPDTGLDQQGHELIDTLLREHVVAGGSALFTTHQHQRALSQSDRLVLLSHGRISQLQASAELDLATLQTLYREAAI
jgi:heme ABC exporter ATP-binding subunit CcmA